MSMLGWQLYGGIKYHEICTQQYGGMVHFHWFKGEAIEKHGPSRRV